MSTSEINGSSPTTPSWENPFESNRSPTFTDHLRESRLACALGENPYVIEMEELKPFGIALQKSLENILNRSPQEPYKDIVDFIGKLVSNPLELTPVQKENLREKLSLIPPDQCSREVALFNEIYPVD